MYKRKTVDEYQIFVHYGQGWEHEITEATYKEAKERRREYALNCPQYPFKILKRRVPIERGE